MNPMKRRTRGVVQANHENRIQTLERRIPEDYPKFHSVLLGTLNIAAADTPDVFPFGFTFPSDEPCELPDCDADDSHTVGDYFLLPRGYQGPFNIFMCTTCNGGCANLTNYLTPVTPGDTTPTQMLRLHCLVEIWRDDEPFGFTTLSAVIQSGQQPPRTFNEGSQRYFWIQKMHPGHGLLDVERDRYALLPTVSVDTLAGNILLGGLVFAVELFPPGQSLAGMSF